MTCSALYVAFHIIIRIVVIGCVYAISMLYASNYNYSSKIPLIIISMIAFILLFVSILNIINNCL